jgi:hypothetical protein
MKFDYGDQVVVNFADGVGPQKSGSVVGITPVETGEQAVLFRQPTGTVLYTVEFGDGSDTLIPESSPTALDA